jgi:ankyrin repeat protein
MILSGLGICSVDPGQHRSLLTNGQKRSARASSQCARPCLICISVCVLRVCGMDIWEAAREGNVGEVTRLITQTPALLDARDDDQWTPLMEACREGHIEVARWLVERGAAVHLREDRGYPAIYWASWQGTAALVKLLLDHNADPTIAKEPGSSALMIAAVKGHRDVVECLLNNRLAFARINDQDRDGKTALWRACYYGRGGVVGLLVKRGADPTIANPMAIAKEAPPEWVSAEGRRECVAALEVREVVSPFVVSAY